MNRLICPAVFAALITAFVGCSSGGDGGAVGTAVAGAACSTDGMKTTSVDGCNLCHCESGQWSCTDVDCASGCTDGQRHDDGCNVCVCEAESWSCTRATCGDEACSAGERRAAGDGCNTCSCSAGQWVCTEMDCTEPCTDGATRAAGDGCNTCSCSGGSWSCTERDCPETCVDGERMSDGCNTCTCSGGQWACTDVACPPTECTDGDTRSGTCEFCTCEGGQWLCSGAPCVQPVCPEPQSTDPGLACPAVVVYARDPATAACCEYGDPCRAPAGWDQFYSMAECEGGGGCSPGDTRPSDDGCNTCTCGQDGLWACTLRACLCEPGTTRRAPDGCNVCTCSAESVLSCTETACSGPVVCGGFAGNTCTDDEYCAYEPGASCGAADASATCEPRPDACDTLYDPVCGCDGQTYDNACSAAAAGTGVTSTGPCAVTVDANTSP